MAGFMGIISPQKKDFASNFKISLDLGTQIIEKQIIIGNCWFKCSITGKFFNDKIFAEGSDLFICTDGTLLNAASLINTYTVEDNFHLIRYLYTRDPLSFPLDLRGDFSGAIYDKVDDAWILFNNHIGSKPLFYYFDEVHGDLVFGSKFQMVLSGIRSIGFNPQIDSTGAYCLLSFGYMLGEHTLVDGIKRLPPGSILRYQNGKISIVQYYKLKNTPYIDVPDEQIIEELDARFKAAIRAEYEKDLEYGYKHITTLSGGLDSRMNVCYAKKMGYHDLLTICFSQSNYLDESIAKKIASDLGYGFLFSSLDNGNFLKEIEELVRINDGLTFYSNSAHVYSMLRLINWMPLGLLHTGQIGDLILGSYLQKPHHQEITESVVNKIATSTKLIGRIPDEILTAIKSAYPNDEIFTFYERCVNGVFNGYRFIEQFSEFSSPFLFIDFLEYAIRIPPKKRYKEMIYRDWIRQKSPEIAGYPWEKTGLPITAGEERVFISRAIKQMKRKIRGPAPTDSMNPFDYWYEKNSDLRDTIDNYYKTNNSVLDPFPNLKEDANSLFMGGNLIEKTQVLTLIAAVKYHKLMT